MKILIIENHPIFASGLKNLLQKEIIGTKIDQAETIEEAQLLISHNFYDLIFCDYFLADRTGLEFFINAKENLSNSKFILVSIIQNIDIIEIALQKGIAGFFSKDCGNEELIFGTNSILAGNIYVCDFTKNLIKKHKESQDQQPFITKRELDIIRLIIKDYKNQDIAELLHISVSTVESHKKNLIKKFNVNGSAGLVRFVIENKLVE
jgi:DNA-binding NarL/FixJ family response regulator